MFKTKTKTLHLKTKTFLWCRPTEKHFSFSAVNENADENEVPFTAENETKTKRDIHFRPKNENESHLIILVVFSFSYIQSPSHPTPTTSSFAFFAGGPCWRDSTFLIYNVHLCGIFSRWHFNPWTVCFPGLLLPSESSFPQSRHCALLAQCGLTNSPHC